MYSDNSSLRFEEDPGTINLQNSTVSKLDNSFSLKRQSLPTKTIPLHVRAGRTGVGLAAIRSSSTSVSAPKRERVVKQTIMANFLNLTPQYPIPYIHEL